MPALNLKDLKLLLQNDYNTHFCTHFKMWVLRNCSNTRRQSSSFFGIVQPQPNKKLGKVGVRSQKAETRSLVLDFYR